MRGGSLTPPGVKFTADDVNVHPVAYKVTSWPSTVHCMDQAIWCVTVLDEGFGNWSVRRGNLGSSGPVLGRDGKWHQENRPSERTEKEIADYRFTQDEAMALAADMAPRVEVQGMTAIEAIIRHSLKGRCIGCEGPYTA